MYGFLILIHFNFIILTSAFNCIIPNSCEINDVNLQINYMWHEKTSIEYPGIICDIRDEKFEFTFPNMPMPKLESDLCKINKLSDEAIEFRFHRDFILSKQFNITNLLRYSKYLLNYIHVNLVNLKGFELDMINEHYFEKHQFVVFNCVKCKMDFYSNGRLVKTCQDIIDTNNCSVRSLFQIRRKDRRSNNEGELLQNFVLLDSQFKTALCPLVFMNSYINLIFVIGLADTFYKRNILTFENRTFEDLNSTIKEISLIKIENINIDSKLLNPSVFQNIQFISFYGQVNMIDGNSFNRLLNLTYITLEKQNYRGIIHKNGIKWIRDLNPDLDINFSNFTEILKNINRIKVIQIASNNYNSEIRLSKLFPDKDFCLYKDFPFKQLVIILEMSYNEKVIALLNSTSNSTSYYTCTYLWLTQYVNIFYNISFLPIYER